MSLVHHPGHVERVLKLLLELRELSLLDTGGSVGRPADDVFQHEMVAQIGSKGGKISGKIAAQKMTKAERTARAKKAAAASAKVRTKNAKAKRVAEKGSKNNGLL
jgi:hypothetical protein